MRRPLRHLIGLGLVVLTLAGCGASSDHALNLTLSALSTPIATAPAPPPSGKATCQNATASLRPPATLPTPNHMPAHSLMAKIQRQGHLVAGVNEGAYKFGALNPATGNIEGFEVDLVNEVAKAIFGDTNHRVRLVALAVPQRFSAVQKGQVDIVADTITITCYRRTLVDFSSVYYDASQRLLVPSNSRVQNIGQLAGQRVCASKGSTPIDVMNQMEPANSRPLPVGMPQAIDCLVALQQGQGNIAGISTDSGLLLGFKAQDPNTKIVGGSLGDVPYGMAINQAHPEFVSFVNGVLAKVKSDGTWQRLYKKWLGDFTQGSIPAPPPAQYDG